MTPPDQPDVLSDAGAALRFAARHGADVRFDHRRRRWLLWREHRWKPDNDGAIMRLALNSARMWQKEAVDLPSSADRDAVLKFALRLERRDGLQNMLALATTMKPIADTGEHWDADPWLLGVPNGVVDLRTGRLRNGRPDDGITMQAGTPYDPDARGPRWAQFISEIFGGDQSLAEFVHRAVGYSLT
ncbi:MAG: DNA primase, partial [Vicinamibacterales bacterium]